MKPKINATVYYEVNNKIYYGKIIGFKMDKINVSKHKYLDFSGKMTDTWIDLDDLIYYDETK